MNRNNLESMLIRAKAKAKAVGTRAAAVGTGLMVSGAAFANASQLEPVKAEFEAWKVAVVGLVIAFAVVLWAIRGAGLAKPR